MPTNSIVLSDSPNLKIKSVTLNYDRYHVGQVFDAILFTLGRNTIIADLNIETVILFLADDVDADYWHRMLKNHQHKLSKPAKRKRTRCNQPRKRANYARLVLSKEMVA